MYHQRTYQLESDSLVEVQELLLVIGDKGVETKLHGLSMLRGRDGKKNTICIPSQNLRIKKVLAVWIKSRTPLLYKHTVCMYECHTACVVHVIQL